MFTHIFSPYFFQARMRGCYPGGFERGHAGPGARGPKFFDAGALRYVVLQLISEQPRHGYEIIKEIQERIGGGYSPSPGVIYPLLQLLQDEGYIVSTPDGNKVRHSITPDGLRFLDDNRAFVDAIMGRMSGQERHGMHDIRSLFKDLRHGLLSSLRRKNATPEQIARIREILRKTIDDLNQV